MKVQHLVYEDTVIAVALVSTTHGHPSASLALRWLQPRPYTAKDGSTIEPTNSMGGATDWFVVPVTYAAAIGRTLVEQNAAGLKGFDEDGFAALVSWLVDDQELHDSMCY